MSVTATLLAFVAVVAVVAEPADPSMLTPVKDWLALARLSAIAVVPTYSVEFPRTVLGIVPVRLPEVRLVRAAPEPEKPVAVKTPVLGLYWYFVELVNSVVRLPVVTFANRGYLVAFVVVSSVTVAYAVGVVHVGAELPLEVRTCPEVPAETKDVVPEAD